MKQKSPGKSNLQLFAPLLFLIGLLSLFFFYHKYLNPPPTPEELEKENRERIEKLHAAGQRKEATIIQRIRELGPAFERVEVDIDWKLDHAYLSGEVRSMEDLDRLLSELKGLITEGEIERGRSAIKLGSF